MAVKKTWSFKCPSCGNTCCVENISVINAGVDPKEKAALFQGVESFFGYTCKRCKKTVMLSEPILYHDDLHKVMIQYVGENDEAGVQRFLDYYQHMKQAPGYQFRIVASQNEFYEKVKIFDAGLDDRYIEILKLMTIVQCKEQIPNRKIEMAFFEPDKHSFVLHLDDNKWCNSPVSMESYEKLVCAYKNKPMHKAYIIDQSWALEAIKHL